MYKDFLHEIIINALTEDKITHEMFEKLQIKVEKMNNFEAWKLIKEQEATIMQLARKIPGQNLKKIASPDLMFRRNVHKALKHFGGDIPSSVGIKGYRKMIDKVYPKKGLPNKFMKAMGDVEKIPGSRAEKTMTDFYKRRQELYDAAKKRNKTPELKRIIKRMETRAASVEKYPPV
jgi:hypothetical protein